MLLERDDELECLELSLQQAATGSGCVVFVEGPPGIGKSELLREARQRAGHRRWTVLAAGGGEIELELAFGVVRQLFAKCLRRSGPGQRESLLSGAASLAAPLVSNPDGATSVPHDDASVLHGLYWLCANLADQGPVLVVVDDVHWADDESLHFLGYLARRLDDLPLLLVLAARTSGPGPERDRLSRLSLSPSTRFLRPRPLSRQAVDDLVRSAYEPDADDGFCAACYDATGGNPLLLRQLLIGLRDEAMPATASSGDRVRALGPDVVARGVLLRVGRLSPASVALVQALAVLGAEAELRHAAAVAELDVANAAVAADALATADILTATRPLQFVHPVVRNAVYADMPTGERAVAHARAARALAADGAEPERVAVHLLACEPEASPWVVETLQASARRALAGGAVQTAIAYLRRALAEPPPLSRRGELLLELGRLEAAAGATDAEAHLWEALRLAAEPSMRAAAAAALARRVCITDQAKAAHILRESNEALAGDRELSLRVDSEFVAAARWIPPARALVVERMQRLEDERLPGDTPSERQALAFLAQESVLANRPAGSAIDLARRALAGGRLLAEVTAESPLYFYAVDALTFAGAFDLAAPAAEDGLADARLRLSLPAFCLASLSLALVNWHRGRLSEAEADLRNVIRVAQEVHGGAIAALAESWLLIILLEGRRRDEAEQLGFLRSVQGSTSAVLPFVVWARGRLRLEDGRLVDAVRDLLDEGRRQEDLAMVNPAVTPWRSDAALAIHLGGDDDQARALAHEELSLAEAFGAPRPLGVAMRVTGLLEGGGRGLELLRESVAVLSRSGAHLEHARALAEFGAALRRSNRRSDARKVLLQAAETAAACGGTAVIERARHELHALGVRPRRLHLHGLDALTPSERRVATMVADGLTNREIAQALFISVKTVEKHLGQAFAKTGVTTRRELRDLLMKRQADGA